MTLNLERLVEPGSQQPDSLQQLSYDQDYSDQIVHYLKLAWRRKSLIALGAAIGLVVGSLSYSQTTPVYRSDAQVLVVKKRPDVFVGDAANMSQLEDYVSTHLVLIRSPLIVGRAVEDSHLQSLQTFAGKSSGLTDRIIAGLSVTPVSKDIRGPNNIFQLSYSSFEPQDCGTIVNAVLDSYRSFLDETYKNVSDETVKIIREARDILDNDLKKKEQDFRAFRETAPLMTWQNSEGSTENTNPRYSRVAMIESQRTANLMRSAELEGQLGAIDDARKANCSPAELLALVSELAGQTNLADSAVRSSETLKDQLSPLLIEMRSLLAQYGPDHPQVVSLQHRIDATRRYVTLPPLAYGEDSSKTAGNTAVSFTELANLYIQRLGRETSQLNASAKVLDLLLEGEYKAVRELSVYEKQEADFRNDIARTQVFYERLVERLHEATLVQDYGGYDARVIAPAGIGGKVSPLLSRTMTIWVVLGVLGGVCLGLLAENFDKSFKTPDDIRRRLALPVMGHIPVLFGSPAARGNGSAHIGLDPMLVACHQSRSIGAEAFRGVRTALNFGRIGEGHRIVQIASPGPGDGKSTLTANIAVSIAQSGMRVLLIDADLRKPTQGKIFAIRSRIGLATVIAQQAELPDAVWESPVHNLWVLPSGAVPPDPSELLASPRFPELLESLREQYDYILIDSPPLLAITDASIIAPRVDGVVLAVRIAKHSRRQAELAMELLHSVGANVLGVIVNRVESSATSAYQHHYYGYGEMYGDHQFSTDQAGRGQDDNGHSAANGNGRKTGNFVNAGPGADE